jgi:hypothetical protein
VAQQPTTTSPGGLMITRGLAGRIMLGVGVIGLVVSVAGVVVGHRLLNEIELALHRSLVLTADSVEALEASVAVAGETTAALEQGLAQAERTTRSLSSTLGDGEEVLTSAAELTAEQIAGSLENVEASLPALIQAAAVIDRTLTALSALPLGPRYAPDEPFDQSLRSVQGSLRGLPQDLREQASLIRDAGGNLGEVRRGTTAIAADLAAIRRGLADATELLSRYAATATEASVLIDDTRAGLTTQMRMARLLLTVLGLSLATGQIVPLSIGWALLRPPAAVAFLQDGAPG